MKEEIEKLLQRHNRLYKRHSEFSPSLDNIITEVSTELNIPKVLIGQIVMAQFKMIRNVIMSAERDEENLCNFDDLKSIRLIYFGTFKPSKRKFDKMMEAIKKQKDNV